MGATVGARPDPGELGPGSLRKIGSTKSFPQAGAGEGVGNDREARASKQGRHPVRQMAAGINSNFDPIVARAFGPLSDASGEFAEQREGRRREEEPECKRLLSIK